MIHVLHVTSAYVYMYVQTKALLLTTFCKFLNLYPELVDLINGELRKCTSSTALASIFKDTDIVCVCALLPQCSDVCMINIVKIILTVHHRVGFITGIAAALL